MSYTTKCNWGWKVYDKECDSIEEACEHAKNMFRLCADSGPSGNGYLASQLPRIDQEIDRIQTEGGGKVWSLPDGRGTSWTIKRR